MPKKRITSKSNPSRIQQNNECNAGDTSYTEDGLEVLNIFIRNLPELMDEISLLNHFSKFGDVENVEITPGKTRSEPAQCIIKFKDKIGAGRALRQKLHTINKRFFTVTACPSWQQPLQHNISSRIISLNYYSMERVFEALGLRAQVQLSLCHPHLEEVFVGMAYRRISRHLKLEELAEFSQWELRQLFSLAGAYFQSLEIGPRNPRETVLISIFVMIGEKCLNISKIKAILRPYAFSAFRYSINLNSITELVLFKCNLYEEDLRALRQLKNLQTLCLSHNSRLRGHGLVYLRKVERLSLCKCEEITQQSLIACSRALKLRYLDLRLTNHFRSLPMLAGHWSKLETLKVTYLHRLSQTTINNITLLPCLKSLELHLPGPEIEQSFYQRLAQRRALNMIELKVTGRINAVRPIVLGSIGQLINLRVLWIASHQFSCSNETINQISNLTELEEVNISVARLSDEDIYPLINKCRKLTRLNLRYCRFITTQLIWHAINILGNCTTERTQPLIILLHGTFVERDIVEHPQYLSNCHLVKLRFHSYGPKMGLMDDTSLYDICDDEKFPLRYDLEEELPLEINYDYDDDDDDDDDDNDNDDDNLFF